MKRSKIIFVALLLTSCIANAQQDIAADYAEQYAYLYKAYIDEPTNVATLHEMALFYSDTLNPMMDYAEAMRYVTAAEQRYLSIVHDRSKYKEVSALIKKKVTVVLVRQTKQNIIQAAQQLLTDDERGGALSETTLDAIAEAFGSDAKINTLVGMRRMELRYQAAKRQHSMESYLKFINDYPGTNESEVFEAEMGPMAAQRVADARNEAEVDAILKDFMGVAPVRRAAAKRKSAIAYADLMRQPSHEGYRAFLAKYPGSDEYADVLERMGGLAEMDFEQLTTPRQYADFVHASPDNPLAEKAMDRIRQMIRDERDMQALDIYLKEFPLDESYNDIYLQYYQWHTVEGNAAPLILFAKHNPKYPYTVALDEDMAAANRFDQINLNEPFNEKEFRSWASKIYHLTGKRGSYVALQRTLQQYIAGKEWNRIPERIAYFALSFEDYCQEEVAELKTITQSPDRPECQSSSVVCPVYDMRHPVLHSADVLYYDKEVNGVSTIQTARLVAGKRGSVWRGQGPVQFVNMENSGLHIYNFYDNGERMLLGRGGDIMTAVNAGGVWRIEETLPAPVNTAYEEYDAFMLPDGSGILFASDRPGGHNLQPSRSYFHGDTALASDIWFVARNGQTWAQEAVCLGFDVNSDCMECSPLLSADKKTLYFITDRRGLGYGDIYYASRDNVDDWRHWSTPRNAGKEVNTGFDEQSLTLSYDGDNLIFGSNCRGRYGCFKAPYRQLADHVLVPVTVKTSGVGIAVDVMEQSRQIFVNRNERLEQGGSWSSSFMPGKRYLLLGRCNGLLVPSASFVAAPGKEVVLQAYDVESLLGRNGEELALPAVLFEGSSSDLCSSARYELDHLADFLTAHPGVRVEMTVDVEGVDDTFCFNLSRSRGVEVKNYLVFKGIEPERIAVSAYGNSRVKKAVKQAGVCLLVFSY